MRLKRYIFKSYFGSILCIFLFSSFSFGQNVSDEDIEVYLSFRHRGVINATVISYYKDDVFYLPINEIFQLFQIQINVKDLEVSGEYSSRQLPYKVDFANQTIKLGNNEYELNGDDYLLSELDFYLRPKVYSEVFGLDFSVDFNNLSLNLETIQELPIVEKQLRNQRRVITNTNLYQTDYYDLKAKKDFDIINGGFLDYSISSFTNSSGSSANYNTAIGLQLMGGDLQGSVFGNYTNKFSTLNTDNLRWKYIVRNNPYISTISVGQSPLNGVLTNSYTGVRLTNDPIEPRRLFDEFIVQGSTFSQAEVELYLNNSLVDYQQANELGDYRFITPLYYGASRIDLKIYGPTGQILERSSRIQVPFTFLPVGEINYNLNAGYLDNPLFGNIDKNPALQANTAIGLTNWLTTKIGVEYFGENVNEGKPTFSSSLSTRLLANYIINLQFVNNAFIRSSLSAVFPNSSSFNVAYTEYINPSGIYNNAGSERLVNASFFYPIQFAGLPINLRSTVFTRVRDNTPFSTFRLDGNTRVGKINLRLGYGNSFVNTYNPFELAPTANIESSATYTISKNQNIPKFLQGTFLRAQMVYSPRQKKLNSSELVFSRNFFGKGRLQMSYRRNFVTELNSFRFNLVINLQRARVNSTVTSISNQYTATQNIRGSVGYDSNYNNFLLTNRNQVGRSGTAIRFFVDNNANGTYEKDVDDKINEGAVRINRIGSSSISKDGILYYSQMQPNFRYNMELNKGSIRNPMLVPDFEKFSIITDPNTFKKIDIPFYMSGVFEGEVQRQYENNQTQGIGGVKVLLTKKDGSYSKEFRSFSDGTFYEYEIPPGEYELKIDSGQLDILKVKSNPAKIDFTVQAKPEGDFIAGLSFVLIPTSINTETDEEEKDSLALTPITLADITDEILNSQEIFLLKQELETKVNSSLRLIIQAQNAFYNKNIQQALSYINQSLEFFETAQGYALKGSIQYFNNNRIEAVNSWRMALRFDPDIYIPTLDALDQRVTVSSSD